MNNEIRTQAGNALIRLGITPNLNGFTYIVDCVDIFSENPAIKAKDMYEIIAIRYNTDANRVERSIRHAFTRAREEEKIKYFGDIKCSNTGYISVIAWKERIHYE